MMTASVMAGRAEAGEMVWTPAPAMLKAMESVPAKAFDSMMAARRVQLPVPSLQKPSPGLLSAPSPVELTVKIVSKRAEGAADARARRAVPACDALAAC